MKWTATVNGRPDWTALSDDTSEACTCPRAAGIMAWTSNSRPAPAALIYFIAKIMQIFARVATRPRPANPPGGVRDVCRIHLAIAGRSEYVLSLILPSFPKVSPFPKALRQSYGDRTEPISSILRNPQLSNE
jgi:hypothetical protein